MTNIKQSLLAALCALAGITVAQAEYFNNENPPSNNRAINRDGYSYNTPNSPSYSQASDSSYGYDRDNRPVNRYNDRSNTNRYSFTRPYTPRTYADTYNVRQNQYPTMPESSRDQNKSVQMEQDRVMLQEQEQPIRKQAATTWSPQVKTPVRYGQAMQQTNMPISSDIDTQDTQMPVRY